MALSTLARGPITNHILGKLRADGVPVGDGEAPKEPHGWQGKQPGPGVDFIPYYGLTTGPASNPVGSVGDSASEWTLAYQISTVQLTRDLAEQSADRLRHRFQNMPKERVEITLEDGTTERWKITQYRCTRIGGVQRITSAFPDYWTQQDDYLVRVSKER